LQDFWNRKSVLKGSTWPLIFSIIKETLNSF
jgi:hypothetical protein